MSARPARHPDALCQLGRKELAAGRLSAAQHAALRALKVDQQHAGAYLLLGMAAAAAGRPDKAEAFIDRALALDPDNGEACMELARVLSARGKHSAAVRAAGNAEERAERTGYFWDSLGVVYSRARDFDRALRCFGRATDYSPATPAYHFNLGSALQFVGQSGQAAVAYQRAIDLQPGFYRAYFGLAQVVPATDAERYIPRLLERREALEPGNAGVIYLNFALAELYDKLARHQEAFDSLMTGNAAMRAKLGGGVAETTAIVDKLTATPLPAPGPAGHPGREPIFVLGMPRTGTTLVDRILSSHSQVYSAGELENFGLILKRASDSRSSRLLDEETIRMAATLDWSAVGEQYLDSTRPATGHTAHFIDKTPLNFLLIGFIHCALPNARIICLRRHPLDTVLSNFRQLFALNASYYNYAYDLEDCARFYLQFDRLMRHWDEQLPGRVLRVDYERLVADQEAESRRIVAHCGLDWEPACLDFDRNAAPVATASAVQVREGMYARAVGRWQHYASQLQPARRILEAGGIEL